MKKRVLLLFIGVISFLSVWSQNDSLQFKSIFVGVRNNKYASIGFAGRELVGGRKIPYATAHQTACNISERTELSVTLREFGA